MDIREVIGIRRAYRSLDAVDISDEVVRDLAECAQLAPSCFNNQPWRFVFVREKEMLENVKGALSKGNAWARDSSMIMAVFSRKDLDCVIKEREYNLFDTGMATAFIILRATELGLVAHPIAGYNEAKAKEVLGIPEDMRLITMVIFGKHSSEVKPSLSKDQVEREKARPERFPLTEISFNDKYGGK